MFLHITIVGGRFGCRVVWANVGFLGHGGFGGGY